MGIGLVLFSTTPPHRGHGAVVFVAVIRPEPEADRKVLSCRVAQHDRSMWLVVRRCIHCSAGTYCVANALTAAAACLVVLGVADVLDGVLRRALS
ncbi:hypothetical protein ABT404_11855 [Streptomyces hyaluromycini]|uniref:DUF2085 domain-containing protein n=1 Tax=Streptomyces hyaluromycini TaxID=1377993 RepID=A0ABV1WTS2_9ACTN